MPALPVINDVCRVALNWVDATGQIAANVIHIKVNHSPFTTTEVMTSLDGAARADMWDCAVQSAAIIDVAITPLDGVSATDHFTPPTPAHWKGEQSGDFVPQVATLIKLSTGFRGRSHRGRVYIPFVCEDVIAQGALAGGQVTAMTLAWSNFQTALGAAALPCQMDVASYKLATSSIVETFQCEGILGTQRRRQGRLRGA